MASETNSKLSADDAFIAAAANRSSHVADWQSIPGQDGQRPITVLAYGSNRSIALSYNLGDHDSNYQGVSQLIPTPFTSPITTLKYVRSSYSQDRQLVLVAGAGNGQVAVWTGQLIPRSTRNHKNTLPKPIQWTLVANLKPTDEAGKAVAHHQKGTVQAIGVSHLESATQTALIAIGTSDGTITLWSIHFNSELQAQANVLQVISSSKAELGSALPLDIAFAQLGSDGDESTPLIMATASTDRKIVFWIRDAPELAFRKELVLGGHDDWVRSLNFSAPFSSTADSSSATQIELASGSQDGSVRLWRIRPHTESADHSQTAAPAQDAFERLAKQVEDEANANNESNGASSLSNKTHIINTEKGPWALTFDALLTGHEGWVSGVRWHPPTAHDGRTDQPAALLSASVDNSIIFWTPSGMATQTDNDRLTYPSLSDKEATSSLWLPAQRFGELGVAGAGALGMFGALWNPEWNNDPARQLVASHAWAGAVHLWAFESGKWISRPAITGHHLPVKSARWSPNGDWFLTASLDRTARLFGEHFRPSTQTEAITTWHELARPQTHGYDIMNASWLDNLAFNSAADEKVSRIFAAPQGFLQSAKRLGAVRSDRPSRRVAKHNVLALNIPTVSHARNFEHFRKAIEEATLQTAKSSHEHLYIILCSPLFNGLVSDNGGIGLSFTEMETLLSRCYGYAWAAAVSAGNLLLDIDVLLVAETAADKDLQRMCGQHSGSGCVWTVQGHEPAALAQSTSKIDFLTSQPSTAGQDDPSPSSSSSSEPFPRHDSIAMGGTFDHLHVGHKILLSMAALIATRYIIVGVTGDLMLAKKSNPHLIETIEERLAAVNRFLTVFRSTSTPLRHHVVELEDVSGPAGTDADLQAVLVTDETVSGAETIAKVRAERGLKGTERYTIGVIGSGGETDVKGSVSELAAAKIGSTAIRDWLSKQSVQAQNRSRRRRRQDARAQEEAEQEARPMAASVPALGLSNRAVFDGQAPEAEVNELGRKVEALTSEPVSSVFTRPPVEEELLVSTLWPELDKLYGHGYELLAGDSSPDCGRLTATSCKSTTADHAVVRVYDRKRNWKEVGVLSGHSLTITKIRFSPNSKFILTVSRDRSWRVFQRHENSSGEITIQPYVHLDSAHTRIIWDASWSQDSRTFATGSRDKSIKIWQIDSPLKNSSEVQVNLLTSVNKLPDALTALAFDEKDRLAVGLENGTVLLYQLHQERGLELLLKLENHHSTVVNEVGWRPCADDDDEEEEGEMLLSAGEDGVVRLTCIRD
ncbi:unnamed protein product [Sympodiomycopsis kandeliae]